MDQSVLTFFLIYYFSSSEADATRTKAKIVIDHDGGADDALAITMCLLNEKYFNGPEVVALSVTHGNVNLSQAVINSARILQLAGRSDIPIYSGAEHALIEEIESDYYFGKDGLGDDGYVHSGPVKIEKQHAAVGLIELSKIYEGELVIMAIGPLTNVALAARMDPELINRISHLYVGGGNLYDEQHPTAPEFNAEMDAESYYITTDVAELNKVTIVPFSQIRSSLTTTRDWRENVLGKIDTPIMKALNSFERVSIAHSTKWVLLDPAVAAITLNDGVVRELRNTRNSIILCGQQRAITTNNFTSTEPNSKLVYSADLEIYKQMLIDIYTAELKYY